MIKLPSLKAMAESKAEGIQKATYFRVDPRKIEFEEGFNLREEGPDLDAHIERLYQAMKSGAFIPPVDVSVVDGRIIARDGHCRTRASLRLIEEGVEYLLEARQIRGNEVECVVHMLGSANGKSLTPLEQGRGFLRLTRHGLTITQIADRVGVHRSTVDTGLALAEAPVAVQRMITAGEVSTQVAIDAIKKHGSKAVEYLQTLIDRTKGSGATKVTAKHVSGFKVPKKAAESFATAAQSIRQIFAGSSDDELMEMDDEAMIPIPAKDLKALLSAYSTCTVPVAASGEDEL